uniref:SCAP-1 n=1 Tax=Charonia tritonis TaxID=1960912 RepID=A0A1S6JQ50_9CAEN|nr:sCAP-1 precursor [Charonia tritonis]
MKTATGRMVLALLFTMATVTQAMNYLALPRMGRSAYIAFPRLGRGYLAFPRLGRSQGGSDANKDGTDCCMTGLNKEWMPQEGGTTTTRNICPAESCCQGLREILAQKPDGVFYSMCIPACASEGDSKATETSRNVLRKLKDILQN